MFHPFDCDICDEQYALPIDTDMELPPGWARFEREPMNNNPDEKNTDYQGDCSEICDKCAAKVLGLIRRMEKENS